MSAAVAGCCAVSEEVVGDGGVSDEVMSAGVINMRKRRVVSRESPGGEGCAQCFSMFETILFCNLGYSLGLGKTL